MTAYDYIVAEEGDGALDAEKIYADKYPNPDAVLFTDGGLDGIDDYTSARTSFRSLDIDCSPAEPDPTRLHRPEDYRSVVGLYRDLHRLNHGGTSIPNNSGLDERERGLRVRPRDRDQFRECMTIAINAGFSEEAAERAARETVSADCNGQWSFRFAGSLGYALARAALIEGLDEERFGSMCDELDVDRDDLLDYAEGVFEDA